MKINNNIVVLVALPSCPYYMCGGRTNEKFVKV